MEEEGLGGGARLVISDLHTDCDLDTRASGLARDATAQGCWCIRAVELCYLHRHIQEMVTEVDKTRKASYIMYLYRECVEESYCSLYHYFTS